MKLGVLAATVSMVVAGLFGAGCQASNDCDVCHRPMHAETHYETELAGGEHVAQCCPRCGLRFQAERDDVVDARVADYATNELFDAREAFYVEDSSVQLCRHGSRMQHDQSGAQYAVAWDRCLPSLVAFQSRTAALSFLRDHGGAIRTYDELLAEIR